MEFKYLQAVPSRPDASWFSQAYQALLARLSPLDQESGAEAWLEMATHWNEVKAVVAGERARVNWDESLDVADEAAADRARVFHGEVRPLVTENDARIRRAILDSAIARQAVQSHYGTFLIDQWECAEIANNPINIELDVKEQELVTRYHALRGRAQIDVDGTSYTLTELEKRLELNDESVRQGAFEAMMAWYQENRRELDDIYLALVQLRDQAGRNLGFADFVPLGYKRMRRLDYGPAEAARFRQQILLHVTPLVRQLRADQARRLAGGTEIKPWNRRYLPGYGLPAGLVPLDGQRDGVLEIYGRLDRRLAVHFQRMIDHQLIDLENRPGKRGGAFSTSMPDRDEVRIFCNSTGAASDVRTLLHESGHAFQSWESQWIEAVELRSPTLEACEIHSMGMEFLAYPYLNVFFDPENERRFKSAHLIEAMQFLCYASVVDGFQHEVYANPAMDAEQLADAWRQLWHQFMVGEDWRGYEQELGSYWHHKLHIFARPFYYIDYALAQLCALQLWSLSVKDPAGALERYLQLCHLGGTHSFSDLVKTAGLQDPFAESTLLAVVQTARDELGLD